MSCWFTPARAAISDTRAPVKPLAENSSTAASMIFAFVRSGSRCRSCGAGARRPLLVVMAVILPSALIIYLIDKFNQKHDTRTHDTRRAVPEALGGTRPAADRGG